jgi:hypothetical protein
MGAKLISEGTAQERRTVKMSEMRPCEWGRIIYSARSYNGHLVMRTASRNKFEVMDMTDMRIDSCWTHKDSYTMVELAKKGEKFTFEIEGQ